MKSAMNCRRLFSNVFHDVDLAAVGPVSCIDVVTQHPKRRPNALARGDLNSRFKPPVSLGELVLGEQSCRSIVASYAVRPFEGLPERFDYQHATVAIRICSPTGVGFEFVVAP